MLSKVLRLAERFCRAWRARCRSWVLVQENITSCNYCCC
jgi:hypothetical protein